MTYEKLTWKNLPDETTPLSAERLSHMETQYEKAVSYAEGAFLTPSEGADLAKLQVGDVNTVPYGEPASAEIVGTPPNQKLNLSIPGGEKGDAGNGSVDSVNGKLGPNVVLTPSDVGGSTAQTEGTLPLRGSGGVVSGIGTPVLGSDAATKDYVDSATPPSSAEVVNFNIDSLEGPVGSRVVIPTHVSPSGGQATHPSVVFFEEPWNGYRYWMAVTPYPGGSDAHEDPNIVASLDGISWVVPSGLTNPLDDAPGSPKYNSDTDLVFAQGKLWCFWRFLDTGAGPASENIYFRSSEDGVNWGPKTLAHRSNMTTRRLVSPSLSFNSGKWTMYAVDVVNPSANKVVRLISTGSQPTAWGAMSTCTVNLPPGRVPWHLQIRPFGGKLYGILNDCISGQSGADGELYFIESSNGTSFTRSSKKLIPRSQAGEHDNLYRATFVPEFYDGVLGFRVWYSAWTNANPPVWNVYRTFVSVPVSTPSPSGPEVQQFVTQKTASSIAMNAGTSWGITFPKPFTSVPSVIVVGDSARLTLAVSSKTTTGFTLIANNWSNAAANNVVLNCNVIAAAG